VDAAAEKVTDQDITEYFNRNSFRYTNTLEQATDEIRAELARTRARRAANNRATELTVELVAEPGTVVPDFATLAGKYGGQLAETGFLAPGATPPESDAGPSFVTAALALTPSAPYSDPVEGTNGYYVLQFREAQESRLPTLAEAKDKAQADLKRDRVREAVLQQGREAAAKVQELVKGGKTFAAACAELKLNLKSAPPFTLTDEELTIPGSIAVKETALGLPTNAVSSFLPTAQGGLFFTVKERWPYDTTQFEKDKITFNQMLLRQNREALWDAWLGNLIRTTQVSFGEPATPPPAPEAEAEPIELPAAPAPDTPPPAAPAK
jgi:hypothetical protein